MVKTMEKVVNHISVCQPFFKDFRWKFHLNWWFQKTMFSFRNSNCLLGWVCSILGIYSSSWADWHTHNVSKSLQLVVFLSCSFFSASEPLFGALVGQVGSVSERDTCHYPTWFTSVTKHPNQPANQSTNRSIRKLKIYQSTKLTHWLTCLSFFFAV